ncbi:MAG: PepSY domain-containing protein [Proteobacteria bacterium]|nr:PepSY domain-containing protein [Pseudomonadota bacterium]
MFARRNAFIAPIFALAVSAAVWADDNASQADLARQASVSKEAAQRTALAAVPNGMLASSELEREHGKLVWSFDIKQPGSKDIVEIQVDAVSGGIVSKETEDPKAQAREAAADRKSAGH